MKRVLFAASFIALSSSASFALEPGCNHAIQNWQNGSQDTCPVADAGNQFDPHASQYMEHRCDYEKYSSKDE